MMYGMAAQHSWFGLRAIIIGKTLQKFHFSFFYDVIIAHKILIIFMSKCLPQLDSW